MSESPRPDPQPSDPYVEPDNATTEEWFGQSVERDTELADELVEEEGGDVDAAERRFDAEAPGADEQRDRHADRAPDSTAG
jgi:hypothetical protein